MAAPSCHKRKDPFNACGLFRIRKAGLVTSHSQSKLKRQFNDVINGRAVLHYRQYNKWTVYYVLCNVAFPPLHMNWDARKERRRKNRELLRALDPNNNVMINCFLSAQTVLAVELTLPASVSDCHLRDGEGPIN